MTIYLTLSNGTIIGTPHTSREEAERAINGHGEVVEMIEAEPVRRLVKAIREAAYLFREAAYLFRDAGPEEEFKQAMKELEGV